MSVVLFASSLIVRGQLTSLLAGAQAACNKLQQLLRVHRLHDVLLETSGKGTVPIRGAGICGQRECRNAGRHLADPRQQDVAILAGQAEIGDQHIGPTDGCTGDRFLNRRRGKDPGAGRLEHADDELTGIIMVFDHEHGAPAQH